MSDSREGRFPAGHYYSPIPGPADLETVDWENSLLPAQGLDLNVEAQRALLSEIAEFAPELEHLPEEAREDSLFYWRNPMLPPADAWVYYSMIRSERPATILEVGSGYSTAMALLATKRNGSGKIVSIEPSPPEVLLALRRRLHDLREVKVQQVPKETFMSLKSGDILFIDSSHVSKTGSDVNYLVLNVLPVLKPGVLVHFHDIFLPHEYPPFWLLREGRYFNEQYLLLAFLLFNTRFEIMFANALLTQKYEEEFIRAAKPLYESMPEAWRRDPTLGKPVIKAGSLWLRVRQDP